MSDKPSMTRQGYELIAGVIRDARAFRSRDGVLPVGSTAKERARYAVQLETLEALAQDFATELRRTNGRFDRERFLRACDPAEQYTNRSRATRERNDLSK